MNETEHSIIYSCNYKFPNKILRVITCFQNLFTHVSPTKKVSYKPTQQLIFVTLSCMSVLHSLKHIISNTWCEGTLQFPHDTVGNEVNFYLFINFYLFPVRCLGLETDKKTCFQPGTKFKHASIQY